MLAIVGVGLAAAGIGPVEQPRPVAPDGNTDELCRVQPDWVERAESPDPGEVDDTILARITQSLGWGDTRDFTIFADGHLRQPHGPWRLTTTGLASLERCLAATHVTDLGTTSLSTGCEVGDLSPPTLSVRSPGARSTVSITGWLDGSKCADDPDVVPKSARLAYAAVNDVEALTTGRRPS